MRRGMGALRSLAVLVLVVSAAMLPFRVAATTGLCDLSRADVASGPWKVVLDEEFPGIALDPSLWTGRFSNYTAGHENELQSYVPRNAKVGDGHLTIETDKEKLLNKNYTSAWIDTQGKFEVLFGRICVRAMIPGKQPGFWPAHWLMPAKDHGKTCWPGPGEVDIMEMINGDGIVHGSLHYNAWFKETHQCIGQHLSATGVLPFRNATVLTDAFHEYAIEWSSESLTYFVDGVKYHATFPADLDQDGVPQVPMYIILNSALGGGWAGNPTLETQFPIHHTVDYVRVLQSTGEPGSQVKFSNGVQHNAAAGFSPAMSETLRQRSEWMREHGNKL